ncbi:curli production assembly/transport component CsgG [Hymenobacter sediminis]|uniref:CsgG/HfaB family protein n=1 Tax=Hymenobacter sediminis TaxID=2218621 RepID=UPI000DA6BDA9|nr:CsgG/HfaB family protein [Hymenobacter sediminis]RPD47787.1 curli production assembly/transport component CsgG [Hymenobacter sediminis]
MVNSTFLQTSRGLLFALALGLSGCAPYLHQPIADERARLGAEIQGNATLRSLPEPKERIVVAVYKFRDQTGQYKPTENGASFSTAVTQGATSILLRALEESKWFNPIERENLGNLLNERKIIRSTRAEYSQMTGRPEPALPSLLFAGVILEGGIISYDSNILTGGAGIRYFGAGGSGQYRQDRVTVYLRAISTSTGEILKTVYTTKTILSQQVDASLFRFVKFQRLLEAETGFTYNEPTEIAVKDAIEKSVQSLVFEGLRERLWAPRYANEATDKAVAAYYQEKSENQEIDVLGRVQRERRGTLGITLSAATVRYSGDLSNPKFRPGGQVGLQYQPGGSGHWATLANVGRFELGASDTYRQTFTYAELGVQYRLYPRDPITPLLLLGGGATTPNSSTSNAPRVLPHVFAGAGFEYLLTNRLSIHALVDNHYYFSDQLDGLKRGRYNDFYWAGRGGITWYIGNNKTKTINR